MKSNKKFFRTICKMLPLLLVFSFISCEEIRDRKQKTSKMELRQLVQETRKDKVTTGYYFLIGGSFDSYENKITTVKVFAKVDGRFRLIEMPIEEIRISIQNNLKKPNIEIEFTSANTYTDEELVSYPYERKIYVINCPEQYLPEKLVPIAL